MSDYEDPEQQGTLEVYVVLRLPPMTDSLADAMDPQQHARTRVHLPVLTRACSHRESLALVAAMRDSNSEVEIEAQWLGRLDL